MFRLTKLLLAVALLTGLCYSIGAQADVFNMGLGIKNLDTVTVGDTGNAADNRYGGPIGAVGYTYSIGKYEVTAAQYADFLNHKAQSDPHGLYNSGMNSNIGCGIVRGGSDGSYTYSVTSGWENRPVNYISFWDACRFTNWVNNGQGTGSTETGAYTLNGVDYGSGGHNVLRNTGPGWFISSGDEWYKAAYYKAGGTNAGYWTFATQSDDIPSNAIVTPDPGNNASHDLSESTLVGEFENSESAYGTFDQTGNLWEYCDNLVSPGGDARGMFGGSWANTPNYLYPNSFPQGFLPDNEYQHVGFRLVQIGALTPGTISGTVNGPSGVLAGATISITGMGSTATGSNGSYSMQVPPGTYTVVASKLGYDNITVTGLAVGSGANVTQNFTLGTQTLQGQVTLSVVGTPIPGVTVKTADGLYSTTTNSAGNYSMYVPSGSQTIIISKVDYLPVTTTVTIAANTANTGNFVLTKGWDFVTSWSVVNPPDPNGVWSYGYDIGAGLTLYGYRWDMDPGVSYMCNINPHAAGGIFIKNFNPYPVGKNYSGIPMFYAEANTAAIAPPQTTGETPASAGTGIARFTSPTGGYFRVQAAFTAQTYASPYTQCNVSLVRDDVEQLIPSTSLSGFIGTAANNFADSTGTSVAVNYDQNIDIAAGDTIDARVVGTGWAGVSLKISSAPDAAYVKGVVTSSLAGNQPVSGATVWLIGPHTYSSTTAADGSFTVVAKPNTTYLLKVQRGGFNDYTQTGFAVGPGEIIKNVQLQHTDIWNFAVDFDNAANPNGPWECGYLGGDDSYHRFLNGDTGIAYTTDCKTWQVGSSALGVSTETNPDGFVPGLGWVFGYTGENAGPVGNGGAYYMEPGMAGMVESFGRPSIRWTAPANMVAKITLQASNQTIAVNDPGGWGPPGVKLVRNGAAMFTGTTYGFAGREANGFTDSVGPSPVATFETALPITAGDVLDLQASVMYGNWPPLAIGVSWQIEPFVGGLEVGSVAQMKAAAVGTTVFLTTPKTLVTSTRTKGFADGTFFIEESDRSSGMKLIGNATTADIQISGAQSYKICLTGKIALDGNGEKVVQVMSINSATPTTALQPLGMASKSVTASNKLVRVWGKLLEKVSNTDPASKDNWPYLYWTINDGGQNVKIPMIGQGGWMNTSELTGPIVNDYVAVTGIARLDGTGQLVVMPMAESCINDYVVH